MPTLQIILDLQAGTAQAGLTTTTEALTGMGVAAQEAGVGLVALNTASADAAAGQETLGMAGRSLTATELEAAAATDAFAAADLQLVVATDAAEAAAVAQTETEFTLSGALEAVQGASLPLIGSLGVLAIAGMALKGAYDATVGSAITLGDETRTLEQEIGSTAEQSGALIFAANSVGVSFESLSRGLNIAIRALESSKSLGIEPNIEGLAKLSDMYLALEPGVQRDAFLLHEFGRSGADLAPLMLLGGDGIKALGDQAAATGDVLSGPASDKVHAYELSITRLGESVKGTAVQLGLLAIGADNQTIAVGLGVEAIKKGIITDNDWNIIRANAESGVKSYAVSIQELTDKIQQHDQALDQDADKAAAVAVTTQQQADAFQGMADNVSTLAGRYPALTQGERDLADATAAATKAVNDQNIAQLLQAGLAGTVTKNAETYDKVVDSNADKVKKLKDEIAKLTAANGQVYTATTLGTASQEDYNLAVDRANLAQARYQEALAGTVDKQGNLHETSALTLEGLRIGAESAANSVAKLGDKLGTSVTGIADYSTKIGEDRAALDLLTTANSDAETAMHKANKEFAYQQAAAGLTGQAALDFALAMGEIDEPTYNASKALQTANAEYLKTGDLAAYEQHTQGIINVLNGVPLAADPVPAALQGSEDAFYGAAAGALALATNADLASAAQARIHDQIITITTRYINETYGPGGVGYEPPHKAGGGPVLAGMPYWVGEVGPEVFTPSSNGNITPAGQAHAGRQGGGDTIINNIYDTKTAALVASDARQRKLANLNGYMN